MGLSETWSSGGLLLYSLGGHVSEQKLIWSLSLSHSHTHTHRFSCYLNADTGTDTSFTKRHCMLHLATTVWRKAHCLWCFWATTDCLRQKMSRGKSPSEQQCPGTHRSPTVYSKTFYHVSLKTETQPLCRKSGERLPWWGLREGMLPVCLQLPYPAASRDSRGGRAKVAREALSEVWLRSTEGHH